MTRLFFTLVFGLFVHLISYAVPKYWVGPDNGNWSNPVNWANAANGVGGATVPGTTDSVFFTRARSLVYMDVPATIRALFVRGNVTLHTAVPVELRIMNSMEVAYLMTLKDSTSAAVPFKVIFNGSTNARGTITGDWIFEGRVPPGNPASSGATFIAEPGSIVTVFSVGDGPQSSSGAFNNYFGYKGGQIIFKRNTGYVVANESSLRVTWNCNYILDYNLDAVIPAATWSADKYRDPTYGGILQAPAASIIIKGTIEKLTLLQPVLYCARLVLDLPGLNADKDLGIPDGSRIEGNLEVYNTNNHTLSLLASNSIGNSVHVTLGTGGQRAPFAGNLIINGDSTIVTLAKSTPGDPADDFRLEVWQSFRQSGGNFSLQDYNGAAGSVTLEIRNDFMQTGGTFYTNSTSTTARFKVLMASPPFITGPSGSFQSLRAISAKSGTIDNANHTITLAIDHGVFLTPASAINPNGVILQTPLSVGRLELVNSPLTTTVENILTINNPAPDAIKVAGPPTCCITVPGFPGTSVTYINGPLKRATNSTQPYLFPTGKGNRLISGSATYENIRKNFHADSFYITPSTDAPSIYQGEYFQGAYPDSTMAAPLKGVSNTRFWNISKVSGADAVVSLFLQEAVAGATAEDAIVVSRYVNSQWVAENGTVLPGNSGTGVVSSRPLSSFGLFAFGYGEAGKFNQESTGVFDGLNYKYYEGGYAVLPDFNTLTPLKTGRVANFDLGIRRAGVNDSFAIVWEGYINIPTAGSYTFETLSDDGSKLYFNSRYSYNGAALINNDGTHPLQSSSGTIEVAASGRYPVTITYMENYGEQELHVFWSGPGIPRQEIPVTAFTGGNTRVPANGLNYKYYEGNFDQLPDFSTLTPVNTGNSANVDISVRPEGVNEHYAFVWEGTIKIPVAGTYTFETISDDGSKLYFNGKSLVNNDGLHAPVSATGTITVAAGVYTFSLEFFEKDGGETMQVYWSGPGIPREPVPDEAFIPGALRTGPVSKGLNYKYYEGDFNSLPDFNLLTPVKMGVSANIDLGQRNPGVNDHYAFLWEGMVHLPTAGTYTFETISDDGSKVYFNMPYSSTANSLVNNDGLHWPVSATGLVNVAAPGNYPVAITFFEKDGGETMQLFWTGPGFSRQPVPDSVFTSIQNDTEFVEESGIEQFKLTGESTKDNITAKVYPNPFEESFSIDYYNTGNSYKKVSIGIYNLQGSLMYTYQPGSLAAGYNRWVINLGARHLKAGAYFTRLHVNGVPVKTIKVFKRTGK